MFPKSGEFLAFLEAVLKSIFKGIIGFTGRVIKILEWEHLLASYKYWVAKTSRDTFTLTQILCALRMCEDIVYSTFKMGEKCWPRSACSKIAPDRQLPRPLPSPLTRTHTVLQNGSRI